MHYTPRIYIKFSVYSSAIKESVSISITFLRQTTLSKIPILYEDTNVTLYKDSFSIYKNFIAIIAIQLHAGFAYFYDEICLLCNFLLPYILIHQVLYQEKNIFYIYLYNWLVQFHFPA